MQLTRPLHPARLEGPDAAACGLRRAPQQQWVDENPYRTVAAGKLLEHALRAPFWADLSRSLN